MSRPPSRLWIPLLVTLIGVLASLWTYRSVHEVEAARQLSDFTRSADERAALLRGEMESAQLRVESLQQLYAATGEMKPASFANFLSQIGHDQHIQAYAWLPRVSAAQRPAFEAAARAEGLRAYSIRDITPGGLVTAELRDEYFPTRLIAPSAGREGLFGVDLSSELQRRLAMDSARDAGLPRVSAPVTLLTVDKNKFRGLLLFAACYRQGVSVADSDSRRKQLQGFALGVVRISDLFERILSKTEDAGLDLRLNDSLIAGDDGRLHTHWSSLRAQTDNVTQDWFEQSPLRVMRSIDLAGREYELTAVASPEYLAAHASNWPLLLLLGGLGLTTLTASLVGVLTRRKRQVELLVETRTAALQASLQQLSHSEEHHRSLFERLKIPMLVIDPKTGGLAEANVEACLFYGYSHAQLCALNISDINPMARKALITNMAAAVAEQTHFFEYTHRLASGEMRQVEMYSTPISVEGRTLLYSVVIDVSGRKRSEAQLRLQSMAVDAAANAIVITDRQGRIERVNAAFTRITGFSADEAIGRNPRDLVKSNEHPPEFFAQMWATILSGKVWRGELRNRRKDGSLYDEDQTIAPVLNEAGEISHFVAIKQDITERNRSREELAEERRRLADIIQGTNVGTWEWDLSTGQTTFNERWAEILGYSLAELGPTSIDTWANLTHPDDLAASAMQLERHFDGEIENYETEARMRHKDGHWVWVLDRGKVLHRDETGKPMFMSGTHQEINDRKAAEAALIEATRHAEAANEAKSRFLATMSHEIRTPLNGILGMAQMLLQPALQDAERRTFARTILNSGQTLLALLNDILDLSKVEAGKLELTQTGFSPSQILDEIAALFSEAAHLKNLQLHAHWQGQAAQRYRGDPIRLRQMLTNLVSNALKFTTEGEINISADEIAREGEKAYVHFAVTDSGMGIPAEKQALLFKPFSQVDDSDTRKFGGTGLGLSIVRSLAQLMEGEVGITSTEGVGSTFWFRVRVDILGAEEDSRSGSRDVRAERKAPAESSDLSGRRVLIVEDNPTNLVVVKAMLASEHLNLAHANNGQEALDVVFTESAYDLILMDCQMPVMDGFEATRRIRGWEEENLRAAVPIIALTAGAFEEDRRHCEEAGMSDFLAKPLDLHKLQAMLRKWLEPLSPAALPPPVTATPAPAPETAPSTEPTPTAAAPTPAGAETAAEPSLAVFDLDELLRRLGGDTEIAQIATGAFLCDYQDLRGQLGKALDAGHATDSRRHAHSLKGAAANTSGLALAECAKLMEHACAEEKLAEASAMLPALDIELERFAAALQSFVDSASA